MKTKVNVMAAIVLPLTVTQPAFAATRYVNVNSTSPAPPYTDWGSAATNIQDAVDTAEAGDIVLVTNGVYATGGRAVFGTMTNRVAVDKPLTVLSVNGPALTVIVGSRSSGSPPSGVRCVFLTNGAFLAGFTLTNGATRPSGDIAQEQSGGGVWCGDGSSTVSNCVFAGDSAARYGGGAFQGRLLDCVLTNNAASYGGGAASNFLASSTLTHNSSWYQNLNYGGGAYGCTLSNCSILANQAVAGGGFGGGAAYSTLASCVVSNNSAGASGGGLFMGRATDSLISSNRAIAFGGGACSNILVNCVLTRNVAVGAPSVTASGLGGGAYHGSLTLCTVSSNSAHSSGGGVYSSALDNCLLVGNVAVYGGAVAADVLSPPTVLNSCTIAGNSASVQGGGLSSAGEAAPSHLLATNCIVFGNTAPTGANYFFAFAEEISFNHCDITPFPTNGFGNIANDPAFVDVGAADLHLQRNSPCINAGNNAAVRVSTDLDSNPRIVSGTVDIGAYEFQGQGSVISYAWMQQYGLPTDGSADYADPDGDHLNNWQEWRCGTDPTNALSVLRLLAPLPTATNVAVSWQSVTGMTYFLEQSTNLASKPLFSPLATNIVGQAGTTTYTDTNAPGVPRFYRVGVSSQ